jgi:signal transduction histidine kinase/CheY-like chemotaxis protein/PAS domain-containing protein
MNISLNLKKYADRYFFSDSLSFKARILNVILCMGIAACAAAAISRILIGQHPAATIIILGLGILVGAALMLINRGKVNQGGIGFFIVWFCDLFFPAVFFLFGGINGGMSAYFVLSITVIFLLTRGWHCALLLVSHVLWIMACYYLSGRFPALVQSFTASGDFEQIHAFLITGFFIGVVIKFQEAMYLREKKKADDTLEKVIEADERSRIMLDATPLGCIIWDMDFNVVDCNQEVLRLFGFDSKKDFFEKYNLIFPEYQQDGMRSADKRQDLMTRVVNRERCAENWTYQKSDGTPIPAKIIVERVARKQGDYILFYIWDLQEYQKMNDEIKRQDALIQTVNNTASVLLKSDPKNFEQDIWECMGALARAVNVDMVYIWKNKIRGGELCSQLVCKWDINLTREQSAETAYEFGRNEFPGWFEMSRGEIFQAHTKTLSPRQKKPLEKRGIISVLFIPVFLRDFFWGFVSFNDCQREREFSADDMGILHSGSLLMANALHRSEMISVLIKSREEALSGTRAKSIFLANMSHEMRTPMNAIIGMTLIAKGAPDPEKKDYCLAKIDEASNHLLGVINDILDMSKIEAKKFELAHREFNFEKALRRAVNVINFRVEEKKQHFTVYQKEGIPRNFIGDAQRLVQVITNLLSNAVKFTPEGGSISLRSAFLGEELNEGKRICTLKIDISDSGIGINPEQGEKLFHSFEQADSNTSRKYGGTGLGLAISKNIVEMMGGKIYFESENGRGTTFSFTVRLERGKDREDRGREQWKNIRILLVDNDPDVLEYFSEIARRFKLSCASASTAKEALSLIEQTGGYDIYFVDWKMPGMGGNELVRRIKGHEKNTKQSSVVVMISAAEWTAIEDGAKRSGVDRFLSKPLFPSAIADIINACLGISTRANGEKSAAPRTYPGKRILLAEDVEINREVLIALLEPARVSIDCAENGREAVEKYCADPEKYDIIFMDLQMPEMDGYEATRRIREAEESGGCQRKSGAIPIIAMTANVFKEDVEKCLASGMNGHVGKPLDLEEVMEKLRQYLSG